MTRALALAGLLPLLALAACTRGTGRPVRQADGGYSLSCKGPLTDCLRHAERLCRNDGYTVAEARDVRDRMGHESGQSQVLLQTSDATIYCGTQAPRPPIELKRAPAADPVAPALAAAPPAQKAPACVPGATQACVGPAGCSGGQACSADGTRFEACNCGQ